MMGQAYRPTAEASPAFLDDLIGDILQGDMSAWRVFHEATVGGVTAEAVALSPGWDDANEIVRGVYEQAFRNLASYDPASGSVSAWLRGCVRQVAARQQRRRPVNFPSAFRLLGASPM